MLRKILFVGVFSEKYSNNWFQVTELRRQGIEVDIFDYRENTNKYRNFLIRKYSRFFFLIKLKCFPNFIRKLFFKERAKINMQRDLLSMLGEKKYDLIFLSKIEYIDYKIILKINNFAPTYYYFMDPLNVSRIIDAMKYAEYATYSSSTFSDVVDEFKSYGANCIQLLEGVELAVFKKLSNVKKTIDVVFVGTVDKKRKMFINYLKKNNINIITYGKNADNEPLYLDELVQVYNSSKIVLNFVRPGNGFSLRVLEAMGTGSFVLTEHCDDLELFFPKKQELDWFDSKEDLLDKIKYYLKNDVQRESIAKIGLNKVINNFSWKNQIDKILEFVNGIDNENINNLS